MKNGDVMWIEVGVNKNKISYVYVSESVILNIVYIIKMLRKNIINKRGILWLFEVEIVMFLI